MSKKKDLFTYRITIDNVIFDFFEDEDEYFRQIIEEKDVRTVLFCTCSNSSDRSILASYCREWDSSVSSAIINSFVNKFLRDADYRKQFLCDGENVCATQKDEKAVNLRCEGMIRRINKKNSKDLRFRDFANLKTFGRDKVSSMKEPMLVASLPESDVKIIESMFDSKSDQIAAMRWQVRGLSCEYAIRKVKTDIEIRNNMK